MLKEILRAIIAEKKTTGAPPFVLKNFLKEYLQFPVLEFIYGNRRFKNFIFTGGSCLRVCHGAPRLSEDLDFDLHPADHAKLKLPALASDLKKYFREKFLLNVEAKTQGKTRLYLKFPVLKELGLAAPNESDLLYVKIEPQKTPFDRPETEYMPISNYGFNFVAKSYNLKFLFTGKINAFLTRAWFKGAKNEVDVKGRDLYDLYWFLQKGVEPDWRNLRRLVKIGEMNELKKALRTRIEAKVTAQKLSYDLKNFFPDQNFVDEFCRHYREIVGRYL